MKAASIQSQHFINRELSWLEFNQRVLAEAMNRENPLLERLKFFGITTSNLDEFFEVRVAGLKQQIESKAAERSLDGLTPVETLHAINQRVRQMVRQQYDCWREELVPALAAQGICLLSSQQLTANDYQWIEDFYRTQVRPVLTPLAIDPAHPFPQLLNKSLNMIVQVEMEQDDRPVRHLAVVQVPRMLPRLIRLPREDGIRAYIDLGQVIGHYLSDLFPGTRIRGFWHFRVTRNSELYLDEEEESDSLLKAVENELHNRRKGAAVRLELEHGCPGMISKALLGTLRLSEEDLFLIDGPLNPAGLMALSEGEHSPDLREPGFVAPEALPLRDREDLFAAIREGDILLHHPYDNFSSIVDFVQKAATDPGVLAIKQTLYRTGGDPRIIGALMNAVRDGKQVTAVVELRARFDEANNIQWARQLEENGVHVVYGLVGFKIHAKCLLVVRLEAGKIRRYVHLATGNYNPTTARLYTDVGLLTCRSDLGEDVTNLFNLLTGICQFQPMRKLLVAPFDWHNRLLELIEAESKNAINALPARIIMKVNALAERQVIEALYRASQAGVKVDLIVRGICCLRPGVPGLSENITVRSIVDRFLEHSRIYYFDNARQPLVFLSSADCLPRNFFRRIELAFPVEDGNLRERVITQLLAIPLADNMRARLLQPDGTYRTLRPGKHEEPRRSQFEFISLALKEAKGQLTSTGTGSTYPVVKLRPSPVATRSRPRARKKE